MPSKHKSKRRYESRVAKVEAIVEAASHYINDFTTSQVVLYLRQHFKSLKFANKEVSSILRYMANVDRMLDMVADGIHNNRYSINSETYNIMIWKRKKKERKKYTLKNPNPNPNPNRCLRGLVIEAAQHLKENFNSIQVENYIIDKYPHITPRRGSVSSILIQMAGYESGDPILVITEKWKRGKGLYMNGITPNKYSLVNNSNNNAS